MGWSLSGEWYEVCSCKMVCRCNFGPAEPDQGWCSGLLTFDIRRGESGGVDLGGTKVAFFGDLPGDFLGGIDVARLYVDEGASEDQRRELEAIFHGERGGVWEGINGMIRRWLDTETAAVEVSGGDEAAVRVGEVAHFTFSRLKTEDGRQTVVTNAPIAAGFDVADMELAAATGRAAGSDLRQWETLGYGAVVPFNWSY